jgi:hypothetical protein
MRLPNTVALGLTSVLYLRLAMTNSVNCVHGSMWLNGFILSSFLHHLREQASYSIDARAFSLRAPEPVKVWIWRRISLRRIDSSLDSTMSFTLFAIFALVNLSYTDAFSWLLNSNSITYSADIVGREFFSMWRMQYKDTCTAYYGHDPLPDRLTPLSIREIIGPRIKNYPKIANFYSNLWLLYAQTSSWTL